MTVIVTKPQFNIRDELNASKGLYRNAWGPAFRAYPNAAQTAGTMNGSIKVTLGAKTFDTHNCFDVSTSRFTPTVPGFYSITAACRFTGGTISYGATNIYKNGAAYSNKTTIPFTGGYWEAVHSDIIYLNGSTDYVEMYAYMYITGGTMSVEQGGVSCYMTGVFVRGA